MPLNQILIGIGAKLDMGSHRHKPLYTHYPVSVSVSVVLKIYFKFTRQIFIGSNHGFIRYPIYFVYNVQPTGVICNSCPTSDHIIYI